MLGHSGGPFGPSVRALAIHAIEGFPGQIFVFSDCGDLFVVDAYKMTVHS